jgi:hypothetical protein
MINVEMGSFGGVGHNSTSCKDSIVHMRSDLGGPPPEFLLGFAYSGKSQWYTPLQYIHSLT